ncbi:MAG: ribosomal-protein-alanine N-acetyltransferase [Dehalococcoidia bacterium]|nr:MAG: ribosomal-protein-alanine N-acetyltransferase [Dehalococcoidia bacterium]
MKKGIEVKKADTMLKFQLMSDTYYVIRPMKYEDISQVAQIDREAFPGEWVFRSQSAYKKDLNNPSVRYIVACNKRDVSEPEGQETQKPPWFKRLFSSERHLNVPENVVGFSGFWMMMKEAHIIAIGVRDGYRRLGIGEGLLIATIELAQIVNAYVVTLEVRASNETAQELYKKYGFRVVGRRLRYYSSDGEDAIIMSTDNITSMPFQESLQQLKKAYGQRHREISAQVR